MIIGLGNDLQSIDAIQRLVDSKPSFVERILTPKEQEQLAHRHGIHRIQYIAGRFSAKEAYAKATGYGIGEHAHWQEIEILNDEEGRPRLSVTGDSVIAGANNYLVALSHSNGFVLANVTVENTNA
ncbi:MAG: holo-ACP synthase [Lactobacillaceae bacterium]|jgi:holo-[acyl-carrier protein] synthase|nr:holo-ACP synthase [Lactobacillaceae bacterium]